MACLSSALFTRLLNALYGEMEMEMGMMRQPGDGEKAIDYGDKSGPGERSEKRAPDLNDAAAPRRLLTQYGLQQMAMYGMLMKDSRQWWKSQQRRLVQCFAEAGCCHEEWPEMSGSKVRKQKAASMFLGSRSCSKLLPDFESLRSPPPTRQHMHMQLDRPASARHN